jgi:hypothetical protein
MSDWDRHRGEHDIRGTVYESDYRGRQSEEGVRGRARQGMESVRQTAQEAGGRAREGADHYFHRHPLVVGAGVFALGVAIGMLLPGSRQEDRWLGEASDHFKERTREAAGKVGDVARTSFEEARETARHEMDEHGLSASGLRESAKDIADQARKAAEEEARNK